MKKQDRQIKPTGTCAVIGIACMFPGANSLTEYYRLIFNGKDAITEVPPSHWTAKDYYHKDPQEPDHTYCTRGGFLEEVAYDPAAFGIPPNILPATDTSQLLGLMAAAAALKDAGYGKNGRAFNRERTSVILGVTGTQELVIPLSARLGHPIWRRALEDSGVSPETRDAVIERIRAAYVPWQENSFPGLLGNVVAGRISNRLNLKGTNTVVDAACASSLSAVNMAVMELVSGRSDMCLTGGVDTLNDIFMHMCFAKTSVLSASGDARPFSAAADGTVLGEGVGMMVLKRLEDAEKDGDRIYAVIKSVGSSSDGKSQSIYAPNAEGQAAALNQAYERAGVDPSTIELLEAHGTGTRVGDQVEFKALKQVFAPRSGNRRNYCALGSVKSMIGHTKAAAGSAGMIKAILSLYHKILPATLKAADPDPQLGITETPFYLNGTAKPWMASPKHPRRAGVSAFGFGGSNFHVVLEEHKREKLHPLWHSGVEIVMFGAESSEGLAQKIEAFQKNMQGSAGKNPPPNRSFMDMQQLAYHAAQTRKCYDYRAPYRLVMIVSKGDDLAAKLAQAEGMIQAALPQSSESIFFGGPQSPGQLAFIYPGQGSQYTGMGRDLFCAFPEAFEGLSSFDRIFHEHHRNFLTSILFPPPAYMLSETSAQAVLIKTENAQPAIGSISLAMTEILRRFGVRPDAFCGHSFGELTALWAANGMSRDAFARLAVQRGLCLSKEGAEDGAMLAVHASRKAIEQVISTKKLEVYLANHNSPVQSVISGSQKAVQHAIRAFAAQKVRTTELPVARAFHSPLVKNAREAFFKFMTSIPLRQPEIPVVANSTRTPYPAGELEIKSMLADQLVCPVDFMGSIESLYEMGVRTFVETGPSNVLTGLVTAILKDRPFNVISLDASKGKNNALYDLAKALGKLAALGYEVQLAHWGDSVDAPEPRKMSIPVTGANFRPLPSPIMSPQPKHEHKANQRLQQKKDSMKTNDQYPKKQIHAQAARQAFPLGTSTDQQAAYAVDSHPVNSETLKMLKDGLKSIQALQAQTAEAHRKFLETQSEAGRTLQYMMAQAGKLMGGIPFSWDEPRPDVPASSPASQNRMAAPNPSSSLSFDAGVLGGAVLPGDESAAPSPFNKDRGIVTARNDLTPKFLTVVSQLTGYPVEMLELTMDLEADLGIDSIKRVEILSTMEEQIPNLPQVSPEEMGGLKTLGEIVDYLQEDPKKDAVRSRNPQDALTEIVPQQDQGTETRFLEAVSELTGYPVEMLERDMDLEADLGIDSIKRVEILSAFEERMPEITGLSPDEMGSLRTLGQIMGYIKEKATSSTPTGSIGASGKSDEAAVTQKLFEVVSELTGYPSEMLEPQMHIETDLGIDSIKQVEIMSAMESQMSHLPSIPADIMPTLKTLGEIAAFLTGPGETATPKSANRTIQPAALREKSTRTVARHRPTFSAYPLDPLQMVSIPAHRKVYVTQDSQGLSTAIQNQLRAFKISTVCRSLDRMLAEDMTDAAGLVIVAPFSTEPFPQNIREGWSSSAEELLKKAFRLTRKAADALLASAEEGNAFLGVIVQQDGAFGFKGHTLFHPLQGGLAGLVKTAALEWPKVCCHALDLAPEITPPHYEKIAERMVTGLCTEGPVEIGLDLSANYTIGLESVSYASQDLAMADREFKKTHPLPLDNQDVVVITGGAKGVTAACAMALSEHVAPAIALVGRTPQPALEPEWLQSLSDPGEIKKAILANHAETKSLTPKELEARFKRHMANREVHVNLARLKQISPRVAYYATDIRDDKQVKALCSRIRQEMGPISAILHGAGVLSDRTILDKTDAQFEIVFDTKVAGLNHLLKATSADPLKFIILFSSVAARFGNAGQVDYAMANEVLNKTAVCLAATSSECQTIALNWGPWDGGMVDATLKKEFQRRHIELIPMDMGARCLLLEMESSAKGHPEVVIGASLMTEASKNKVESAGNATNHVDLKASSFALVLERNVDTEDYPILNAHKLNGLPVVPFALMTEWLGHTALHKNPGLLFQGLDDIRLLSGIKLDGNAKHIRLFSGKPVKTGNAFIVDVALKDGVQEGLDLIHSKARAVLTEQPDQPPVFTSYDEIGKGPYHRTMDEVYNDILFHDRPLRGIKEIIACSARGMVARIEAAPDPIKWIKEPMRTRWISDPLILDSAFQMASLWCFEQTGTVSLPSYLEQYRQFRDKFPSQGVHVVLTVTEVTPHKMTGDFMFIDQAQNVVATLKGYEAIMDPSLNQAFKPGGIRVKSLGNP